MPQPPLLEVVLDEKSYARALKSIERYEYRPMQIRAKAAYIAGARMLVGPLRAEAPLGKTGNLRRSTKARTPRLRAGEFAVSAVGPVAPHRHLVISGTRAHSLAVVRKGKSRWSVMPDGHVIPNRYLHHPGSRSDPFVDRVTERYGDAIRSFIERQVLDIGGITTSFG